MDTYRAEWLGGAPWASAAIYNRVPEDQRPLWAFGVVSAAAEISGRSECTRGEAAVLGDLARDARRWGQARAVFDGLREQVLRLPPDTDPVCFAILGMAELAAKVTYNASGGPAPYDDSSGSRLVSRAGDLASLLASRGATDALWRALSQES